MVRLSCLSKMVVLALSLLAPGAAGSEKVDYLRQIKPILTNRCVPCHGAIQSKSDLRVDTADFLIKGGNRGPSIVPGKSDESLLLDHLRGTSGLKRMPPPTDGESLKPGEILLFEKWIDQGAVSPPGEKPDPDPREHWAFRTPVPSPLPRLKNLSTTNPIDLLIGQELERRQFLPSAASDRRLLLRRLYLDLIGLPPSLSEQESFLADRSPNAYEKVVDRLLASPQYGERWGRHWMDIWRYSDWWGLGAEVRNSQKHMWHWRDWIIESLNEDKGYDQMIREMLAADELYPTDSNKLRGTGFLARSYFKFNRNSWLEEVVEHTSKAFLGLTMNCSKCHDHKYDPFVQEDFYRLRAFFEPYQVRTDMVAGVSDYEKDGIPRIFDGNPERPTFVFIRGDEKQPAKNRPMSPSLPALISPRSLDIKPVSLPAEAYQTGLLPHVLDNHLRQAEEQIGLARKQVDSARAALVAAEKREKNKPNLPSLAADPKKKESLVRDDFTKENSPNWETKGGRWRLEKGRLRQLNTGNDRGVLVLKKTPPRDFEARFRFAILGGEMWKSVGICFDVQDANEQLVYLSAYAGGSKVQYAHRRGTADFTYPPEAMQSREVSLNKPHELVLRVREDLLNVLVDGQLCLVIRLSLSRMAGPLQLITFDAQAELLDFELSTLPLTVQMETRGVPSPNQEPSVEQARVLLAIAEKSLESTQVTAAAHRARFAADRARYAHPRPHDYANLARQAARLEKQIARIQAEENSLKAESEWMKAPAGKKEELGKKRDAARKTVADAIKAETNPGETYTSLRGSLKTVENNLENEESRNRPFPATSTGRRSALARWMTSPGHALTSRVAVNHIWARHFGRPLVATIFDFGRKGASPSHPLLLDWLALEFERSGWSMKHLHRLMVTSQLYQRTSSSKNADPHTVKSDPENRYYWRMNPLRMEAQIVRDSLLSLRGEMDSLLGGPSIPATDENSRRRSIYYFHSHNEHNRFLSLFDDANVLECYRRAESIVPQQALALQNSSVSRQTAEKLAEALDRQSGANKTDESFIRRAFESMLGCSPGQEEMSECLGTLRELVRLAREGKQADPERRARITLIQALLNHNDFVTIR